MVRRTIGFTDLAGMIDTPIETELAFLGIDGGGTACRARLVDRRGSIEYERMIVSVDVVIDQFMLGAFGGVLFRALALGTPVCTFLNDSIISSNYETVPPVLNCRTETEIFTSLKDAVNSTDKLESIGKLGKEWIVQHHSGKKTANIQLHSYQLSFAQEGA